MDSYEQSREKRNGGGSDTEVSLEFSLRIYAE